MLPFFKLLINITYRIIDFLLIIRYHLKFLGVGGSKDLLYTSCPSIFKLKTDLKFDHLNCVKASVRTEVTSEWRAACLYISTFIDTFIFLNFLFFGQAMQHAGS